MIFRGLPGPSLTQAENGCLPDYPSLKNTSRKKFPLKHLISAKKTEVLTLLAPGNPSSACGYMPRKQLRNLTRHVPASYFQTLSQTRMCGFERKYGEETHTSGRKVNVDLELDLPPAPPLPFQLQSVALFPPTSRCNWRSQIYFLECSHELMLVLHNRTHSLNSCHFFSIEHFQWQIQ